MSKISGCSIYIYQSRLYTPFTQSNSLTPPRGFWPYAFLTKMKISVAPTNINQIKNIFDMF